MVNFKLIRKYALYLCKGFSQGATIAKQYSMLGLTMMLLAVTILQASSAAAYTDPLDTPAAKQDLAVFSLLLDVAKAAERLVVVGERGHILYSDDQGLNWQQAEVPALAHLNAVSFPTPKLGWAVGDDAVILHTEDGGSSWVRQYDERDSDEPGPLLDVLFLNEREGLAIGVYGKLLRTSDAGKSWINWQEHLDNLDGWHLNAITASADGTLYIAGEAGFAYRSMDGGKSWKTLDLPHEGSFLGVLAGTEPGQIVVFGIGGYIFTSRDSGDSWSQVAVATQAGLAGGTLLNDGSILIVGSDGVVLKADPQANNFVLYSREDRLPMSSVVALGMGDYLMVGLGGVYRLSQDVIESLNEVKD